MWRNACLPWSLWKAWRSQTMRLDGQIAVVTIAHVIATCTICYNYMTIIMPSLRPKNLHLCRFKKLVVLCPVIQPTEHPKTQLRQLRRVPIPSGRRSWQNWLTSMVAWQHGIWPEGYVIEAGITCQDGTKFAKREVVGLFEGAFYDTDHVIWWTEAWPFPVSHAPLRLKPR